MHGLLDALGRWDSDARFILIIPPVGTDKTQWPLPNGRWSSMVVSDLAAWYYGLAQMTDPAAREIDEIVRRYKIDVWFTPVTLPAPPVLSCATVGTILDVQQEDLSQFYPASELARRSVVYENLLRSCTKILTISEHSKKRIVDSYRVAPDRVRVTHLGALPSFVAALGRDQSPDYPLPDNYVFYPATTWHHKNHVRLIEAIAICRQRGVDIHLVMTGIEDVAHQDMLMEIKRRRLKSFVHWIGRVTPECLPSLYRHARLLAFPSLYEGFGLPLIEAMLCGCPIVASRTTSIPEVACDAALYVNALDPAEIAEAIMTVVRDESLASDLRQRGYERAGRFSFDQTARETLSALEDAARTGPMRIAPPCHVGRDRIFHGTCRYYFHMHDLRHVSLAGQAPDACELGIELEGEVVARLPVAADGRFDVTIQAAASDDPGHELVFHLDTEAIPNPVRLDRLTVRSSANMTLDLLPPPLPGEAPKGANPNDLTIGAAAQRLLSLADMAVRRIALYGSGSHTRVLLEHLKLSPLEVCCVVDDNPGKVMMEGVPVITPARWGAFGADALVVSSQTYEDLLARRAEQWLPKEVPIVRLYTGSSLLCERTGAGTG